MNLNKVHIQRQFDRSAESYDKVAGMQREIAAELASKVDCDRALLSQAILDAGCGTGYGLQFLQERFPSSALTGLDLAPAMLTAARQQLPNVAFVEGDIESLPFKNQQFDITWSSSAVQWCDLQQAVSELYRVTKPGGQILVSTFSEGTLDQWRKIWGLDDDGRFMSKRAIQAEFESVALDALSVFEKSYEQVFTSFPKAVESIRELGAGNAEKDRSQGLLGLDRYREIKAKFNRMIEQDGVIRLPYKVVFVCAQKAEG